MPGPPDALVRALLDGPSLVRGVEWHEETTSTNAVASQHAAAGAPEVHVVLADRQTAGRGRLGRSWEAEPGTALLCSLLLRPVAPRTALSLLPLLTGLVLAEAVTAVAPALRLALKWPNDLLLDGAKVAGILAETGAGAVVVGIGLNVTAAPPGAAALGPDVDRWAVLAEFVAVLDRRYPAWNARPADFLDGYRRRCATIGRPVRVTRVGATALEGTAAGIDDDGALLLRDNGGHLTRVVAGDVEHVRPA